MHTFAKLLTISAVAFHAMLGCCAHHSHSCQTHADHCKTHSASAKLTGGCSHSLRQCVRAEGETSNQYSDGLSERPEHQHHGTCNEPDCSFASTERIPNVDFACGKDVLPIHPVAIATPASINDRELEFADCPIVPPDLVSSGLALRAQLQVWQL